MNEDSAPSSGPRVRPPESALTQGVVLAWDAIAGTNTVRVLGQDLEDLLVAVGSETGLILPGDSVLLARIQNTYAVLSRIDLPGNEQRALGVHHALVPTLDFHTTPGAWEARNGPAVAVSIGSSRRCMITLSAEMSITSNIEWMSVQVSGASSIVPYEGNALVFGGDQVYAEASRVLIFTEADGLEEGANVFQTMHKTSSGASDPLVGEVAIIVQPF